MSPKLLCVSVARRSQLVGSSKAMSQLPGSHPPNLIRPSNTNNQQNRKKRSTVSPVAFPWHCESTVGVRILDLVLCVNYPSFEKGQPVFRETLVLRGNPFLGPTAPGSHFDQVVIAAFVPRVAQGRAGRKKKDQGTQTPSNSFLATFLLVSSAN